MLRLKGIDIDISHNCYEKARETPTNLLFLQLHNETGCVEAAEYNRLYF